MIRPRGYERRSRGVYETRNATSIDRDSRRVPTNPPVFSPSYPSNGATPPPRPRAGRTRSAPRCPRRRSVPRSSPPASIPNRPSPSSPATRALERPRRRRSSCLSASSPPATGRGAGSWCASRGASRRFPSRGASRRNGANASGTSWGTKCGGSRGRPLGHGSRFAPPGCYFRGCVGTLRWRESRTFSWTRRTSGRRTPTFCSSSSGVCFDRASLPS
mmetsp:Transcript_5697/g.25325  ORF Transcript_5697/g.25325 Transcript_5697/m.25325 type:complete len:217 (+) Transcript_5697:536-1186(+)